MLMFNDVLSLLVSVTVFAALVLPTAIVPNAKLVGERVMGFCPVPDIPNRCGDPSPGKVTVTSPLTAPVTVGLKVTFNVQLAPAAKLAAQVLLSIAKSPLATIELRLTEEALMLVSVRVFAALVVPSAWLPNEKLVGDKVMIELIVKPTDFVASVLPATSVL